MRYQDESYAGLTAAQLRILERRLHDEEYSDLSDQAWKRRTADPEQFWTTNNHCFKKGTYIRGYRKRRLVELIDLETLSGKTILEVGAGTGELSVLMAKCGATVIGMDLSRVGLRRARDLSEAEVPSDASCSFVQMDASSMAFKSRSFDYVVCNAVLHHVLKYPGVTAEIHRVLKERGVLFFAEGIRGNPIYRLLRRGYRSLKGTGPKGDIDIDLTDLKILSGGFAVSYIEVFCLTEGIKEVLARPYDNPLALRMLFFTCWLIDRALLGICPGLRRYCSEVVARLQKAPVPQASNTNRSGSIVRPFG